MAERSVPDVRQRIISSYDPKGARAAQAATKQFEKDQLNASKNAQLAHRNIERSFLDMASSADSHLSGLTGSGQKAVNALADIQKSGMGAGSMLAIGVAGGALAAGAALTAFAVKGVDDFVHLADETRSLELRMGGTAEQSSRLIETGAALGVNSETLTSAFFKLGKSVAGGAKDFDKYGIEIAKTKGGGTDLHATLLNIVDAFNATTDPLERDKIAFTAFGKSGSALIPILAQGREGLIALEAAAKNVISQDDINRAREYEFAQKRLEESNKRLSASFGRELVPAFASGSAALASLAGGMDETEKKALGNQRDFDHLKDTLNDPVGGGIKSFFGLGEALNKTHEGELKVKTAAADAAATIDLQTKAMTEATKATDAMYAAQIAGIDSSLAVTRSQDALSKSITDVDKAQDALTKARLAGGPASDAATAASDALKAAQDHETDSAVALAHAKVKDAEETAKLNGETLSAATGNDIFRKALIDAQAALGPEAAAKLQAYIDKIHLLAGDSQSAALAMQTLNHAASERADAAAAGRAGGGPVVPGRVYTIGERGPETVTFGQAGYVHPHGSAPGAGGGTVQNFNFNAPIDPNAGTDIARDIAWAMKTAR